MPRTNINYSFRKEQLMKLALEQFISKGYEATTITDLQKTFGLTKGGMYHYFATKEEILDAVIEYGIGTGIDELVSELENTTLEKKITGFFFYGAESQFTKDLYKHSRSNDSSIVAYKLREKTIKLMIPVLKQIIREYVEKGIYTTDYPDEISEFAVVLAMAISDRNILPQADNINSKARVDALLDLWNKYLEPPEEHINELRVNLYKLNGCTSEEKTE